MKRENYTAQGGRLRLMVGDMAKRLTALQAWRRREFQLIIADPPYNIGVEYGSGHDDKAPAWLFEAQLAEWCRIIAGGIQPGGHAVLVLPPKLSPIAFMALRAAGMEWVNTTAWCYRFGQCQCSRFISAHVDGLVFTQPGAKRIWNPDPIMEPSDRLTTYADPRVETSKDGGLRVPLDWFTGPFLGRIQGQNAERSTDHQNQLPERYVAAFVHSLSLPGGLVCDPFSGSGTTGAVCNTLERRFIGCELGPSQAAASWERIKRGAARADRITAWEWNDEGKQCHD